MYFEDFEVGAAEVAIEEACYAWHSLGSPWDRSCYVALLGRVNESTDIKR
jgi:hypothetical protein